VPAEQPPGDLAEGPPAPCNYEQLRWLEGPNGLRAASCVVKGAQARAGKGVDGSPHLPAGGTQQGSVLFGARRDGLGRGDTTTTWAPSSQARRTAATVAAAGAPGTGG
jgi:hypothetical protein